MMKQLAIDIKSKLKQIPFVRALALNFFILWGKIRFTGSTDYWVKHYEKGGHSGLGSYGHLAEFKAEVLNNFVREREITTVIEYGCGDGNQLKLAEYPQYIGFDISPLAISRCTEIFLTDKTKSFKLMDDYAAESADLTLSLDVIFHLVEDQVFETYMARLFDSATRYVIIYSSNKTEDDALPDPTVRHRKFVDYIAAHISGWRLIQHIPNRYPYLDDAAQGSFSDFYIYEKA